MIDDYKKAQNSVEAWKIQEKYEGKPHGWIQWKGTRVSMDIHCACGRHCYVSSDFVYYVKCLHCKRIYFCNGYIELIEIKEEPENCVHEVYDSNHVEEII